MSFFADQTNAATISIMPLSNDDFNAWLDLQNDHIKSWAKLNDFTAKDGQILLIASSDQTPAMAILGMDDIGDMWAWAGLVEKLPAGQYQIAIKLNQIDANLACLAWAMAQYIFDKYKGNDHQVRQLAWPKNADKKLITCQVEAISLTRDLINTPANDMHPAALAMAAQEVASRHGAEYKVIIGDDLLEQNFPLIHAVGRASINAPRLIDIRWGNVNLPKLTLIGKGVCFDSGGLDLKPSSNMLIMKKDMGGAANILGLAHMIMAMGVDVNLRIIIPAVENSISNNAFRPMDIITSRMGKTVEIGNTDAEGRLVLADAISLACEDNPDLIIDFATLTGASRVALGTDMPSCFTTDDEFSAQLKIESEKIKDHIWEMPLFQPYASQLDSNIAHINSAPSGGYGGAITAALFLKFFLTDSQKWAHFDLMAWNLSNRSGRSMGGEAQAIRAVFEVIKKRYI